MEVWAANTDNTRTASRFADAASNAFYAAPVAWAAENGITTGAGPNTFSPNSACTRGQIVTFLYRAEHNGPVSASTPAWANAYAEFLRSYSKSDGAYPNVFQLAYIDGDSIPELVISSTGEYHALSPEVYTYYKGKVAEAGAYGEWNCFFYVPDQNLIYSSYMNQGYSASSFHKIAQGKKAVVARFSKQFSNNSATGEPTTYYTINGKNVTKDVYNSELKKIAGNKKFMRLSGTAGYTINSANIQKLLTNPDSLVRKGGTATVDTDTPYL